MKNSIPSDVWERKKALIAKLYKDEEWPLKQVIKQIRSADFNPSETQLRSRLKKWRVTKPSRQTRKKSNASQEPTEDDSSTESTSPKCTASVSPKGQIRSEPSKQSTLSITTPDWYFNGAYPKPGVPFEDPAWIEPHTPLTPSGPEHLIPCSSPYDPSCTSPLDGVLVNQGSMPQFPNAPYSGTTESCLQAPVMPTTTNAPVAPISWSMPQWFAMPPESQPSTGPFYPAAPLSPPIDPSVQMMPQPPHRLFSSQSSGYSQASPFLPDNTAGGDPSAENAYRQNPSERTSSMPCKMSSQPPIGLVNHSPPYYHPGQHPMYSYPGSDPLIPGPISIGL
ncbi:hypothetical protein BDV59DRAFT_167660 [Aspergillus ambiguus]|uniref:uncharacterized protein n=1 Tax=Aspergillus ambiguus TaxID=176160 RepID=UPI003CCCFFF1